jgi:uncharacterized cofD-like protein
LGYRHIYVDGLSKDCYHLNAMKVKREIWHRRLRSSLSGYLRWLVPGLGIKRWVGMILLGATLIGLGLAVLVLDVYRNTPDTWWLPLLSAASLRTLERPLRFLIFAGLGTGLILGGLWGINRALMAPYRSSGRSMVDSLASYRRRERGPRIVAIGGGHGLATLLRGLKVHSHNITAIVSVADDGGSSGRIRKTMGILPPGDIRSCLAALSSDEALMAQLFQYRFSDEGGDLGGHSFGNLFISALAEITGSFEEAVAESGRVLAVHGRVLPATLHNVQLVADVILPHSYNEVRVEGESSIPESFGKVRRVWLEPNDPPAFPSVIHAILAADLIVVGPGSLYTSLLPNLLVPDIAAAISASRALKVYVCNVATQIGETDGYTCGDHIRVLEDHLGGGFFDLIVANNNCNGRPASGIEWVITEDDLGVDHPIYNANLIDSDYPWRHDSAKLAQALMDLYQERTGPLVE